MLDRMDSLTATPSCHRFPFGLHDADEFASSLAGDDFTRSQVDLFSHLIEAVGDVDALWRLDARPLPDEPFDWSVVDPADVPFVRDVARA